uniref:Uncharacterized protein n=1 Tax=Alexandrium catenella TaxID=2925 RepID=A0A7S1SD63_ALECA|mmetsp:Transcript_96455/g.256291  ORF Transcript_96455/g.256291 Transcript_96455/m.256291 type:complete len:117 (+) Transcript_96455:210-560(+)
MGVQLPAHVEVTAKRRQELQHCLSFSVEPALPAGLLFDGRTGNVSGMPTGLHAPRVYTFTASIAATGPGGINLGQVHLASTRLSINVLDPQRVALGWSYAEPNKAGLTVRLTPVEG